MDGARLQISGLYCGYSTPDRGIVPTLDGIDLSLNRNEFVSIIGPSGCGKSTLFNVIAGLLSPGSGEVALDGKAIVGKPGHVAYMMQRDLLLPWRTVLENVTLPLEVGGGAPGNRARDPRELLELVGLSGWEKAFPHELSGGMRQRVSIARALVSSPKLLFMDEPFGALDEITRDRLNEELLSVWERTGTTILFVTHSIYEAAFLAQEVLLLAARPGRVKERVPVDLPHPRKIAMRETPEFVALVSHLRRVLETC